MPTSKGQRLFRVFAWVLGILIFLVMTVLTRVDFRGYEEMEYFQETMALLDDMEPPSTVGEVWLAGWASENATPKTPANLVGYKPRGKYQYVQDSSYVKSLIVGNGKSNIAFLNYELMIVHPYLYGRINRAIEKENLPLDFVYFTATHTHSGIGGYIPGLLGKLAFGGFDEEIVALLEEKTMASLHAALSNQDTVNITYMKSRADTLVANRLIAEDPVDPFIRQLVFEKNSGEKGTLLTFSGHPTILESEFMGLSGDYPHYLTSFLEKEDFDFALFAAGTVGSHRPVATGNQPEDVIVFATALHSHIKDDLVYSDTVNEKSVSNVLLPLALRKAHFRISPKTRLRPWIFNSLFGDTNAHFDMVSIGNTLFISSSGEISGVFMANWEAYAKEKGFNLVITCFNGGYIGYITPDEYYDRPLYEVRDMNWFGPDNGAYFDTVIRKLIDKAG